MCKSIPPMFFSKLIDLVEFRLFCLFLYGLTDETDPGESETS